MDLYAYSKIDELRKLLDDNNIEIDRLRGLRLMKDESLVTDDEIKGIIDSIWLFRAKDWLQQHTLRTWSSDKAGRKHEAFVFAKDDLGGKTVVAIDLSKVHGSDKKRLKLWRKAISKHVISQYSLFNRFVGKNVLYVHARQGGGNRAWYPIDTKHPMYLADVDDCFDSTYCDIYYDLDKADRRNQNEETDQIR